MNRKEKTLSYIKSKEYVPLRLSELAAVLDVPASGRKELEAVLGELCAEGKVYLTKKKRYMLVEGESKMYAGVLHCNAKGFFGFVICDDASEEDIYIRGDNLKDAFDGDRVIAEADKEKAGGRREGHIVRVLERANKTIVGVIIDKKKEGFFRLRPDNRRIYAKVRIKPEDMMGAGIGSRAACEVTGYTENGKLLGRVISVLGEQSSLKSCVEGVIFSNGIKQAFEPETMEEARKTPSAVTAADIKGRDDLRDMTVFTIDGDDARDFDDAVSLSALSDGNYWLGVHIADVSHYVKRGKPLDKEAFERGTSVYLADRVIPMLPEKLSNGICSLNPNEDRLTLTIFMEVNHNGEVVSRKLEKTVIRSKERLTYNSVNAILERGDRELTERYIHIVPTLKLMEKLAETLRAKRDRRGAIQFEFPETEISVDFDGNPIEIVKRERGTSEKIIEEFMILANETVAEYACRSELPFIYRVHEAPTTDKITAFNEFLSNFNLSLRGKIDADNPVHPKALQRILDAVKDTPEERVVAANMLRSLMKAEYKTENLGHFGLAAKYYCHFTSPIRRYPDLIVHRVLKAFLDGQKIRENVGMAASRSSEREIVAECAERDVDDLMKTAYMSQFVGKAFDGVVSGVASFGIFVELDGIYVEGLVRAENMEHDYFEFSESSGTLVGKRTGKTYRIGDMVRVVVARTDMMRRQIDFVPESAADKGIMKKFEDKPKPAAKKKKTNRKKRYKYNKQRKKKK